MNGTDFIVLQINAYVSLEFYLSNNRKNHQSLYYNPYSFKIKNLKNKSDFIDILKKEFFKTMLECLAGKEESDYFVIRGEKNISIHKNKIFSTHNFVDFMDIFLFLISQKKYTEKFIIIKK